MLRAAKIAILVHEREPFPDDCYFLELLSSVWQERGAKVSIVHGVRRAPRADVAVLHVNLTRVPRAYLELASRYPVAINGAVEDISKRRVCTHLVSRADSYEGPVIVKTDRNVGGGPERRLARRRWSGRLASRLARSLPWSWTGRLRASRYPVFEAPRAVPAAVWVNPRLVVQQYHPERFEGLNCMRQWVFLGAAERHLVLASRHSIIKARAIEFQRDAGEVPPALRELRRRLGFDYGKFDYGMADGEVVLYDANRTPTYSHRPPSLETLETMRRLADGLEGFLP